jgi:hypothetical protein
MSERPFTAREGRVRGQKVEVSEVRRDLGRADACSTESPRTGTVADDDPGYEIIDEQPARVPAGDISGRPATTSAPERDGKLLWIGSGSVAGFVAVVVLGITSLLHFRIDAGTAESTAKAVVESPVGGSAVASVEKATAAATPQPTSFQYPMTPERVTRQREKLAEIARAIRSYRDRNKQFPILDDASYFDAEGHPLLSWRVHLLPYFSQGELWQQFKLDEPWDSPHNRPLVARIPDLFLDEEDPWGCTTTRIVTLTGPGTLSPAGRVC